MNDHGASRYSIHIADAEDEDVLSRLWQFFRYDMSRLTLSHPQPNGLFREDHLVRSRESVGTLRYLAYHADRPVGFATLRQMDSAPHYVESLFVMPSVRGDGCAWAIMREVVRRHPGAWMADFQDANRAAAAFWRAFAASIDPTYTATRTRQLPCGDHEIQLTFFAAQQHTSH